MTRTLLDAAALEQELRVLRDKRARGDLPEKRFAGAVAEATVQSFRSAVERRLTAGEGIVAEHHVTRGHLKLSRSVLREPDEEAVSLFLTDGRLFCVRTTTRADSGEPAAVTLDELPLTRVRGLRRRRAVRTSEIAAGAVIAVVALALSPVLLITGNLLVALGVLGILHGLLWPTRWVEIELEGTLEGDEPQPVAEILAPGKKSARRFVEHLERALKDRRAARPRSEAGPLEGKLHTPPAAGASLRVLVIDDESVFRETLAKVLERRGMLATVAASGEEGLRHLAGSPVDVVVVDLKMPGMDGLEVLRRIEQTRPGLPAILLTGHGTATAGLEAIRGGAFDFLLKPVSPERLVLELETAVQLSREREAQTRSNRAEE